MNEWIFWQQMRFDSNNYNTESCTVSCWYSYWIDSVVQNNTGRKSDGFLGLTPSIPQYKGGETAVQKPRKPQKTHLCKQRHTQKYKLNDDVWHFWCCQLVGGDGQRGGDERREKKRSLMIKLSPDLVFDRGSSHILVTRRAHTHTHTHSPSGIGHCHVNMSLIYPRGRPGNKRKATSLAYIKENICTIDLIHVQTKTNTW